MIRADGNSTIGLGHIMRCLSIADAFKAQGGKVLFVTACRECTETIRQRGYEFAILDSDNQGDSYDMCSELPELRQLCSRQEEEITFLVDSYRVSQAYYQQLQELGKVACLEDMGESYPVDLLINYNIYGEDFAKVYQTQAREMLLGAGYMPLRAEFQEDMEYTIRPDVRNVLITTGGGDPLFAAKSLGDAFLQNEQLAARDIVYHIVSGPLNCFAKELKEHYCGNGRVVIHENVSSMKVLMRQCDVVVTATGSTIYEVSALGIPMICFYYVENQRRGAEAIERILHVTNAGDFSKVPSQVVQSALEALIELVEKPKLRERLYREEKTLVDGQGAGRIAKALQDLEMKR